MSEETRLRTLSIETTGHMDLDAILVIRKALEPLSLSEKHAVLHYVLKFHTSLCDGWENDNT